MMPFDNNTTKLILNQFYKIFNINILMNKCFNKCNDSGLKYTNYGVSNKILQSKILTTNGKQKIPYSNSKTNTINATILSGDFEKNKNLLLCLKYKLYIRYLTPLLDKNKNLNNVLNNIINSLTEDQKDNIYEKYKIPAPVIQPEVEYTLGKTYYMVTRTITNISGDKISYFIYKNYTEYDRFIPTYYYIFNFSDPTNLNMIDFSNNSTTATKSFSFSVNKDSKEFADPTYVIRDIVNNTITLKIPFNFEHSRLFIYNKNAKYLNERYSFNTLDFISIDLNAVRQNKPISSCNNSNENSILNNIPFKPSNYIVPYENKNAVVCLNQSSILTGIPYKGLHLHIYNIDDRTNVLFYSNQIYGLYNGTYYLYIPQMYEIAFLNKTQETNFVISGIEGRYNTRQLYIDGIQDLEYSNGNYNFYYGYIKITINGSFQPISMYTSRYGYLGGFKRFVYRDVCESFTKIFKSNIDDINLLNY
jgi:hypothetical protein